MSTTNAVSTRANEQGFYPTSYYIEHYRHQLQQSWQEHLEEIPSLEKYIQWCSDDQIVERFMSRSREWIHNKKIVIVAGTRLGDNGISSLATTAHRISVLGGKVTIYFADRGFTSPTMTVMRDAQTLRDEVRKALSTLEGASTVSIIADTLPENTGDQAEVVGQFLINYPHDVVIVAASIEHTGRMLSTITDAIMYHGLIDRMVLLPLPSGRWEDHGWSLQFTCHEEAFLLAVATAHQTQKELIGLKVCGQYTTRFVRALDLKEEGNLQFLGRAIVRPSTMMRIASQNEEIVAGKNIMSVGTPELDVAV